MVDYYYERYSYNRIRAGAGSRPANGCITCRRTLHIFLITQTDPCTCIFCVLSFAGSSTTATKIKKNCHNIEHTGRRHLKLSRTSNNRKNRKKKPRKKMKINKNFAVASGTLLPSRPVTFRLCSVSFRSDTFRGTRRALYSVRGLCCLLAAWVVVGSRSQKENARAFASPTQKTLRKWPQRWPG